MLSKPSGDVFSSSQVVSSQATFASAARDRAVDLESKEALKARDRNCGRQTQPGAGRASWSNRAPDHPAEKKNASALARELHDNISQRLSLLEMLLQEVRGANKDSKKLTSVRDQTSGLNTDVRLLSHRLHPSILSDLGLHAAFQALNCRRRISGMDQRVRRTRENMPATFSSQDLSENWPPEVATAIYRIAQEALRNVSKHAGKTHVKMILSGSETGLQLSVMDFGLG